MDEQTADTGVIKRGRDRFPWSERFAHEVEVFERLQSQPEVLRLTHRHPEDNRRGWWPRMLIPCTRVWVDPLICTWCLGPAFEFLENGYPLQVQRFAGPRLMS